jgi:hypothetical protein
MSPSAEIIRKLLQNITSPDIVSALVAPDATYVSLNQSNTERKKNAAKTKERPVRFNRTFRQVAHYWTNEGVKLQAVFGEEENVAAFGVMTLRSKTQGIATTTPFSVWCFVRDGRINYMQFMEDTFATAATFRAGGWGRGGGQLLLQVQTPDSPSKFESGIDTKYKLQELAT